MTLQQWTAKTGFEEAQRRIAECRVRESKELDLRGLALEELPEEISKLSELTQLNLWNNSIGDKGAEALSKLTALTKLNLGKNRVGDNGAKALSKLTALTQLNLNSNRLGQKGGEALSKLTALTKLGLSDNGVFGVGDKGAEALSKLTALTRLDLYRNSIGDKGAKALSKLTALTELDLGNNSIGEKGAEALSKLTALTDLHLYWNSIGEIGTTAILELPNLQYLYLGDDENNTEIPSEVLSQHSIDNCLPRLRAHFASLALGATTLSDVKLMILGNGQIGKTQLARRLCGDEYNECVTTTHGIQIRSTSLPREGDDAIPLKIWDFGGQDIYLGTHASLLRTRAVFLAVWAEVAEKKSEHKVNYHTSKNFPLDYWVRYIGDMAGYEHPGLVVQTQCDSDLKYVPARLSPDLSRAFTPPLRMLEFSAKSDHGLETLKTHIGQAAAHILQSRPKIGSGWAAVKQAMETRLEAKETRLSLTEFKAECRTKAGIEDEETALILLNFLHELGTVFYDDELFDDWIILDQQWALDAIYTLFDRGKDGVYEQLTRLGNGRFTPSDLAVLAWNRLGHTPEDQALFLQMMRSCDLCFELKPADAEKKLEAEYLAPQLLPEEMALGAYICSNSETAAPAHSACYTYDQIVPGLFHRLMAQLGTRAGISAEYWRNGLQLFDENTKAHARLCQVTDKGLKSRIEIETRGGRANDLLEILSRIVEAAEERLHLTSRREPDLADLRVEKRDRPDHNLTDELHPGRPDPEGDGEIFLSYSWGGDKTDDERLRAAAADKVSEVARAKDLDIVRDVDSMQPGDLISSFMKEIAHGRKIIIIMSDAYLRSVYCMNELYSIWRYCDAQKTTFLDRIEVLMIGDVLDLETEKRLEIIDHWQTRLEKINAMVAKVGFQKIGRDTHTEIRLMSAFENHVDDMLVMIKDKLNWSGTEAIEPMIAHLKADI